MLRAPAWDAIRLAQYKPNASLYFFGFALAEPQQSTVANFLYKSADNPAFQVQLQSDALPIEIRRFWLYASKHTVPHWLTQSWWFDPPWDQYLARQSSASQADHPKSEWGAQDASFILILSWAVSPSDIFTAQSTMFSCSSSHSFAPELKWTPLELFAHNGNYLRLAQTKAFLNGIKWRAILPSHFYKAR